MNKKLKVALKNGDDINQLLGEAWLNISVDESKLYNPLEIPTSLREEPELYVSWLLTRPEYFSFVCSQIFGIYLIPTQAVMLQEMWKRKFPMLIASRGFGKSFCLALYALLRALLLKDRKLVICGAAFRQSKVIFEYMDTIYNNAPILRDIIGSNGGPRRGVDMCSFLIHGSRVNALPIGDGQKIRGQRANDILADEFASISRDIFENVIAGFASVSSDPIANVKRKAAEAKAKELGLIDYLSVLQEEEELNMNKDNQIIISGTAYYDFNHFGEYWNKWRKFICSRGDENKLAEIFKNDENSDGQIPEDFNWKDYSIIRIPFEMIPRGFMDEAQVARSKATIHSGIYQMEFGACFANDSNGFYKRSLIESCVVSDKKSIVWGEGDNIVYDAATHGNPHRKYVYGVDPASEVDNFSIVILELHSDHRRIAYVWTTNRKQHQAELEAKLVNETDFYSYCARKIRDLMYKFPTDHIAIDSQGGGIAIMEALHDEDKLAKDDEGNVIERPIYPIIDPEKRGPYDMRSGLHILEMVNFASADWTSEANHGLRKDMEDKILLFPRFDPIVLAKASYLDGERGLTYDTLEDCIMEIEELKNELSQIMITQTASGRDKWDTPEVKLPGGKKGRLRKDRYSSLTMANMVARYYQRNPTGAPYEMTGGFAGRTKKVEGALYTNPWYNEAAQDYFDALG